MQSFKLLLALFLALAYTNLVVLARQAELETQLRGDPDDLDDGIDDDDDLLIKDAIHQAAGKVCKVFGERDDKRDLVNFQRRGWFKKAWNKVKDTAKKVWDNVKPYVGPAVIAAVTGKRGQLTDANFELNDEDKRALEEFVRSLDEDESLETLVRKRGWFKKTWNKIKDGAKKVVNKVGDAIKDAIIPHLPFIPHLPIHGKRSELGETEELDEETRKALEEFFLDARNDGNSIDKRGKFWRKVKNFWNNVVKPGLKNVLPKRQADTECDADLDDIREALDVLNTVVGMAQDVQGCEANDDDAEGDDDLIDDDIGDDAADGDDDADGGDDADGDAK